MNDHGHVSLDHQRAALDPLHVQLAEDDNSNPVAVNDRCQPASKITQAGRDLVGVAGFEPTAPRSQSECATKLRYTPSVAV